MIFTLLSDRFAVFIAVEQMFNLNTAGPAVCWHALPSGPAPFPFVPMTLFTKMSRSEQ